LLHRSLAYDEDIDAPINERLPLKIEKEIFIMATFIKDNKEYIEYVVQNQYPAETLWHIAQTKLGNASRWTEIVKKNDNDGWDALDVPPNRIHPNQVLGYPDGVVVSSETQFDGILTVIASDGVNIRDRANYLGNVLVSDKDTKNATYSYKTNSVTKDDAHQRVWVEVALYHSINGHTTGWLPVSGPADPVHHTGVIEYWVNPKIVP
jgi:hypothetical protein